MTKASTRRAASCRLKFRSRGWVGDITTGIIERVIGLTYVPPKASAPVLQEARD
jgi:hypothetical protein